MIRNSHSYHQASTQFLLNGADSSVGQSVDTLSLPLGYYSEPESELAAKKHLLIRESSPTVGPGGEELFTVVTKGYAPGTIFDYALSGAGVDQIAGSLTGSVVIGADGKAYIAVSILNDGQDFANQNVVLTLGHHHETFTVIDGGSTVSTYTLTTGKDTLNLSTPNNLVLGTFGYATPGGNEAGGSLSVGDSINGGAGNSTTMQLYQNNQDLVGYDLLPQGITVQNVQSLIVDSIEALGNSTQMFDTTAFDNSSGYLATLDVQSSLGADYVTASTVTNVTLVDVGGLVVSGTPQAGDVTLVGGDNDIVSLAGANGDMPGTVSVIGASGAVNVTDTNTNEADGSTSSITISSGYVDQGGVATYYNPTNVTASGYGAIAISGETGTVTVADLGVASDDVVTITGGTTVNVTSSGGAVINSGASGNVTIYSSGFGAPVDVSGGANVTVTADGNVLIAGELGNVVATGNSVMVDNGINVTVVADGAVTIGEYVAPTGTINVTDNGPGQPIYVNGGLNDTITGSGEIYVNGLNRDSGTSVTVNETSGTTVEGGVVVQDTQNVNVQAVGGYINDEEQFVANDTSIRVGAAPVIQTNPDGSQYIANAGQDPNGTITINDSIVGYGEGLITVYTNGSTSVSVTGGTAGGIVDIQSIALLQSGGVNPTPGVSTLATVVLDGVAGEELVQTDALSNLTIDDSGSNAAGVTSVDDVDRKLHTLNLSINNDQTGTQLIDQTATTIDATLGTAASALDINASAATQLNIAGSSVLSLTGAATLGSLTEIVVSGAAGLNDGGIATGLNNYADLSFINASAASGAMTVTLNGGQRFIGGSGQDTVTLTADARLEVDGGTGSGNVVVAHGAGSLFTAAHTGENLSGFSVLRTDAASSGTYDLLNVFDGITNVDVSAAGTGAETFANSGASQILSIDASLGASAVTLALASGITNASLTLNLGTQSTAGVDTNNGGDAVAGSQLLGAQGYNTVTLNSNGEVNALTGESVGTNVVRLGDTALSTLTVSGDENLVIGSNGSKLNTINMQKAAASAEIDLRQLGLAVGGVTVNAGAAGFLFTGNVQSLKTDTVNFTTANNDYNLITENGTGALQVNGVSANGECIIESSASVLLATLGNGDDQITGSDATTTITAGNGNDVVTVGKSSTATQGVSVTLGYGADIVTIVSAGNDMVSLGAGTTSGTGLGASTVSVGNGNDTITLGAAAYNVTLGSGNNSVTGNVGATNAGGVTINVSGSGSDTFNLGNGTNNIYGATANGNDTVSAGNGLNDVYLGSGNNTVTLGSMNDVVSVGNGNNDITVGSGKDLVSVGTGNNLVTLGSGLDTVDLNGVSTSASIFTTISGAIAGDSIAFLNGGINGTPTWAGGSVANAEVELPKNATFSDYLNIACSAVGADTSIAWFDFGGNQYIVDDNNTLGSQAGFFESGIDTVMKFDGTSTLNADMVLNNNTITFHT